MLGEADFFDDGERRDTPPDGLALQSAFFVSSLD
jgi:hypothetical protein